MNPIPLDMIYLMKFGGFWLNYDGHKFEKLINLSQFCRLFGIVFIWFLSVIPVFTKGLNYIMSGSAVYIPLGLLVVTSAVITMAKFKTIEKTIYYSDEMINSHKESWELNIINMETERAKKLVDFLKKFLYFFAIFYILAPVIIDLLRAQFGYGNPYKVVLPLDGYFNKLIIRDFKYFLLSLLSFIWFALIIMNNVAFQGLVLYFVSLAIGEMKIIKMKCDSLRDAKYEWNLKDIISNHQMLLRLICYQNECVGMQLSLQNTFSAISNCFVMFLINNSYDSDKILFIFCSLFLMFAAVLLATVCNEGESIQSQSEEMFLSIYNTPWYNQTLKVRKDINLMILQARKSLVYDFKGHAAINRTAFMLIINGSYSYFMLLKSFE